MKCLPESRLDSAKGNVLHDSHAEILAIRAFNRFLLDHCAGIIGGSQTSHQSTFLELVSDNNLTTAPGESIPVIYPPHATTTAAVLPHRRYPFQIKESVRIHMYCSEAPCGDASMELIMSQQDDATPWNLPVSSEDAGDSATLYGRGYFGQLGVVRRKPSRPDAPQAHSKSCSDKLAMKQFTSLLSGLTALVIGPSNAYLHSLVLPISELVPTACQRAFGGEGRLASMLMVHAEDLHDYSFRPFKVSGTSLDFQYSRRTSPGVTCVPSNLAAIAYGEKQECLINGVLQGRKQTDPKGASSLSRRRMLELLVDLLEAVDDHPAATRARQSTYADIKSSQLFSSRQSMKQRVRSIALKGWKKNLNDEGWCL